MQKAMVGGKSKSVPKLDVLKSQIQRTEQKKAFILSADLKSSLAYLQSLDGEKWNLKLLKNEQGEAEPILTRGFFVENVFQNKSSLDSLERYYVEKIWLTLEKALALEVEVEIKW